MNRLFRIISLCLALILCQSIKAETTSLTEWNFSSDRIKWETIEVPHSWNADDEHQPTYFRGKGYYKTIIRLTDITCVPFLRFEGAAQSAEVIVNGHKIFTHHGGYTPFTVPLDGMLNPGENCVEVICDNSESQDRIPLTSGFNKYGGLHNPVSLLKLPRIYFDPSEHGFDRFHLVQKTVSKRRAICQLRTRLYNSSGNDASVRYRITVTDASGKVVKRLSRKTRIAAGSSAEICEKIRIRRPHLWNGVKDPHLYTVTISTGEDEARGKVGLRYYRLDREKGFFLNGKPYSLRGIAMHQDMEGKASALHKEDFDADYDIVQELGCNFLRLAHYPHNNYAFSLCDSLGIIVQTEIPWVNDCGVHATEAYFENVYSQMKEMITSLYNHPSIVFWGMWNELNSLNEKIQGKLDTERLVRETAKLYKYAKELDPHRFVGFAADKKYQSDESVRLKADFHSENCYFGWYYSKGDFSGLTPLATWINSNMGPTCISEYGVGVNPFCHTWNIADAKRYENDAYHPEEYGNLFHESHLQQIQCMPFLNFTAVWILFDFPVSHRNEGYMDSDDGVNYTMNPYRKHTNDKGIVTRDRKTKKDAFYLYKSWWNSNESTLHITGKRLHYRPAGQVFDLKVYSNRKNLKVYRNGEEVAFKESSREISGVIWNFSKMVMGDTPTTFKVVADDGTEDTVTFKPL